MRLDNGWLTDVWRIPSPHCDDRLENVVPTLLVVHNISLPPVRVSGPWIDRLFTGILGYANNPYFATVCSCGYSALPHSS